MSQEKELVQEPKHEQRKMFSKLNKRNKYHSKTWFPLIGTCNNVPLDKGSACKQTMTLVSMNPHTASPLRGPLELNSSSLLILYSVWWVKWLQVCENSTSTFTGRINCSQTDHYMIWSTYQQKLTEQWKYIDVFLHFVWFVLFHSFMLFGFEFNKQHIASYF